ncbi:hypothetical protein [Paraburkholderia heleia]|uniref:hypothetical protein n=1 Tax=Paraburkholderia heleia TaxID=634127 RepID=UPI002AB74AE6|nr:hypothetical protein [Paraburkholderia heleia]
MKLGEWPAMSFAGAITAWEKSRVESDSGAELSALRRKPETATTRPSPDTYSVRQLCRDYLQGYVEVNRKTKGAVEVARIFKAMLGPIADMRAASITRAQAFGLLESPAFRADAPELAPDGARKGLPAVRPETGSTNG